MGEAAELQREVGTFGERGGTDGRAPRDGRPAAKRDEARHHAARYSWGPRFTSASAHWGNLLEFSRVCERGDGDAAVLTAAEQDQCDYEGES